MAAGLFYYGQNAFAFFEKPFSSERCEPVGVVEPWQLADSRGTWQRGCRILHQTVASSGGIGRAVYDYLRNYVAVAAVYGGIVNLDYMQNHRIVCRVAVMVMTEPVGRTYMHFNIPRPLLAVDFYGGVEKVGAGIGVERAGMYYAHFAVVHSLHVGTECQTVLPYKLEKGFHGALRGNRRLIPLNYAFSLMSASIWAGVLCSRG